MSATLLRLSIASLSIAAVALPILCCPAARAAEAPRTAVYLGPTFDGDLTPAEKTRLVGRLREALDQGGYASVDDLRRDDEIQGDPRFGRCLDTITCKLELAERLRAELLLEVEIHKKAGSPVAAPAPSPASGGKHGKPAAPTPRMVSAAQWTLSLRGYVVKMRTLGATVDRMQPVSDADVEAAITSAVSELLKALAARGVAALEITTTPSGASVLLDDQPAGTTPLALKVYDGPHRIAAQLNDTCGSDHPTALDAERDKTYRVALALAGAGCPAAPAGRAVLRTVGPLLIGAGAAVAGLGAYYLALNGQDADCATAGMHTTCANTYSTATQAGITLGVGAAALVGGAVMTWLAYRSHSGRAPSERAMTIAPAVGPRGAGIVGALRF